MAKKTATKVRVKAGPTKRFFVQMLTRDIDLADAILDLLDNCIDGVLRELSSKKGKLQTPKPYKGYWAKISATENGFEILDNCGGIPENVAKEYAFMLGRRDESVDSEIETVGMYGIGMKRAIFKMGTDSTVFSHPKTGPYRVDIPESWLVDDSNWELELQPTYQGLKDEGTHIVVRSLEPGIARQFTKEKSTFLRDLHAEIARHYALILDKGFVVELNGSNISSVDLNILAPTELKKPTSPELAPYIFSGKIGEVQVELAIGFYRPLLSDQEIENELKRSSSQNAGWTIICNDRVVLYNDRSAKTGWGTRGVPAYHNQFISIAGTVVFRSRASMELPLNTTKRGLDMSSETYQMVLEFMQDGLKKFTSYTNHWKQKEALTQDDFKELVSLKATEIPSKLLTAENSSAVRKLGDKGSARVYSPDLPRPEVENKKMRICFSAKKEEFEVLADYYFDDKSIDRSELGRRCFDECLETAKQHES